MAETEVQAEEREVLLSIYDGDENFKHISPNTFQYKYGEHNSQKSFVLEIKWGETYPNDLPIVDMDVFYNKHIVKPLKEKIMKMVLTEAEQYLGMSMTYSLFEFVKEHFDNLINEQPEVINENISRLIISDDSGQQEESKKTLKKEVLTKAQKRRQWQKLDGKGEKPRGWNWVDIVKHLSQTGSKDGDISGS